MISLSETKTPQTVTLQVTILCQQISKKKQHAPEHSFALTLRRSFVTIFWQKKSDKIATRSVTVCSVLVFAQFLYRHFWRLVPLGELISDAVTCSEISG